MDEKYFCMAPWSHIQQNSYGEINPCCMFYGKDKVYTQKYDSLQVAFDGSENARLRQKMLNGEYIDSCKKCYRDEELGLSSYRQRFNERYSINEKPVIRELELALGNKCNFKCVTCNTRFSSSWYDDDILLGRTYYTDIGRNYKSNFNINSIDLSQLVELKILGGEPFLENDYLKIFKTIDKKHVTLFLVTNNSIFPSDEWLIELSKFKEIRFVISLDGVYDIAEFVRYGKKFSKFEKNYKKWVELSTTTLNNITVIPHYVFHTFNCLNLNKTLDWIKSFHDDETILSYDFLESPTEISVKYLPNDIKNYIIESNNNFLMDKIKRFLNTGDYDKKQCDKLKSYYKFLNVRGEIPDECKTIVERLI